MSESTPTGGSNGSNPHHHNNNNNCSANSTANGKKKRQKFPRNDPTDLCEGIDFDQFDAMVPGMDKTNAFVCGSDNQVEQHITARKKLADWVGTCKDYKNAMVHCLKSKTVPTFAEPTPPKPDSEGGTTPKPQMERCTIKLQKNWDNEEQWEESRGRLFRTILSICTAPLRNKLEGTPSSMIWKRTTMSMVCWI